MLFFRVCFFLYFIKLSARNGFFNTLAFLLLESTVSSDLVENAGTDCGLRIKIADRFCG